MKVETPRPVNSACLVIMCGTCIGGMGFLNFSIVGAFYTISWPIVVVVYRIYLKRTMAALKNDIGCLVYYNTVMAIVVLTPFVLLSGELKEIFSTVWFWDEFGFWLQMILTTLTGLIVQVSMLVYLLYTSPLSLTVASVSKVRKKWCFEVNLTTVCIDCNSSSDGRDYLWKPIKFTGTYKHLTPFFFYLFFKYRILQEWLFRYLDLAIILG